VERDINNELRGMVTNMTMMDLNDRHNVSSFLNVKQQKKRFNSQIILDEGYSFTHEEEDDEEEYN
jgi:hypothetical protein